MAPSVAGIRLNIGLAYFRQNDFASAIPPFESVVRDMPGSEQARYLLGWGFAISLESATQKPPLPSSLYGHKTLAS
jgi:Tfp pilus assembly protein PilF